MNLKYILTMLRSDTFEALMWAHRYAIDYNGTVKNDNITRVFLKEFTSLAPHLSSNQAEHLRIDLDRYLESQERLGETYPEEKPSEAVYEYQRLLAGIEGSEDAYNEPVPFNLVYWACMYCITRNSYSAVYAKDVYPFLKHFTRSEKYFLMVQIHSYIVFREAGSDPVDDCWYDLHDYLEHELERGLVEVTASDGKRTETAVCFVDKKGNYRPVDSVSRAYTYIPADLVVSTRTLPPNKDE